ncbi:2,3-bisphosphoglycerate-independent phosphoglycerate mutase [bioreactor metagenome]|uniref:2,3-bisphosphoglycerate-independent phosphoglycerate mutase n=1 Tax=bioreactor metagenome TaxID=1076179 RepID=A0A644W0B7_9ZZZZ|nr:2,3-bisphosphoglycerate-independent phosphoglycerate mutase [Acidaminococcaceae bacterium]
MAKKPVMLMILDGWGIAKDSPSNAATQAKTPNLTALFKEYPNTQLACSGLDVGLPEGQMGNSEVGHLNIGAGRIVYQELTRISKAIEDGDFFKNSVLQGLMSVVQNEGSALHIMGLLSDGGVHSHQKHLYGLLEMAKKIGLKKVYIHVFLDGRDTPPQSAIVYVKELEAEIKKLGVGEIATVSGRYYAMDRDKRWDRVEKAYNAITLHQGDKVSSAAAGIEASYAKGVDDEFVVPFIVGNDDKSCVKDKDGIIFFNFRPDRARQITRAFVDEDFPYFQRLPKAFPVNFVCMAEYDATIKAKVAFPPTTLVNTLGEVVAKAGLLQLRIAETEKYAHVTFFFNGGNEVPNVGEDRELVPSPKVATYDLQPEMSAYLLTEKLLELLDEDKYDMIILNFANPDMVGHTGILRAAIKAMEVVDECVGRIIAKMRLLHGVVCITADHGNCECMENEKTHVPYTAHTTNKVPFIVVDDSCRRTLHAGKLSDIAPTLLELLSLAKPAEMTGTSLLNNK